MFTKTLLFTVFAMAWSLPSGHCSFENQTYQKLLTQTYKNCALKKENVFLTKAQLNKAQKNFDYKISSLLLRYKNPCNQSRIYIDSHIVRTLNETVLIEVKNQRVQKLEIASFMEPKEYLPPKKWIALLVEKGQKVDALTGATLSQNALKRVVQKYIIIDNILNE